MTHFEYTPEVGLKTEQIESTSLAKEAGFLLSNQSCNTRALNRNEKPSNSYTVKPGDSLNSIIRRELVDNGKSTPSRKSVALKVEEIIAENAIKFPSLIDRPNHIEPGWVLTLDKTEKETYAKNKFDLTSNETNDTSHNTPNSRPLIDHKGDHQVTARESISSIALQELKRRGISSISPTVLEQEINRLVTNNKDRYPSLVDSPEQIEVGWQLKVWDYSIGPEPNIDWKPWKDARPGEVTIVKKADRVVAGKNAWIIVEPGGQAITNPGSKAFLFQNARIEKALPGSMIVNSGGEVNNHGTSIQVVKDKVKINW